ncbi:hypothetical protein M413DRAFT_441850 [Hebeloma cylindrosporum]|uniref:Letm1 RBD domain-containing protein n=1 Tax=Hebeloma cylindrosporum TaxID=76867 RepID=A0A0C3CM50_HEBCY|nr:hypothetical protein M413DRAFT_441850 [Hebeloma cylindrosporum h7]
MLRQVGRGALQHSIQRKFLRVHATPCFVRLYSIPTPSTNTSSNPKAPLPLPPQKKPKIDLRPGPIKPKPPSAHAPGAAKIPPSIPTQAPHATTEHKAASPAEEVKKDLQDAEQHGILIPPPADANWIKRTLHQAIQLFKFYYRGVKLIFSRRKDIAIINSRIKAGGPPLTRAEYRLIHTQKDDINKVIPFLIIALLLEEVIPLIAIYAPFMLPSTCILPSQRERIEAKRSEKAATFSAQYYQTYRDLKLAENPSGFLPLSSLHLDSAPTAICGLLGLSTIGIDYLRIRRIRRHLEFITRDDQLLLQSKNTLSPQELSDALRERGMLNHGLQPKDLQSRLSWWLDAVKNFSTIPSDDALARRLSLVISHC